MVKVGEPARWRCRRFPMFALGREAAIAAKPATIQLLLSWVARLMVAVSRFGVVVVLLPRATTPEYEATATTESDQSDKFTVTPVALFEAPAAVDQISTRACVVQQLTAAWRV